MNKYKQSDLIAWGIAGAFVLGMEILGLVREDEATITSLTRQYVPAPIRAGVLGWLCYHFLIAQPKNTAGSFNK